jgi:hypothetical protein
MGAPLTLAHKYQVRVKTLAYLPGASLKQKKIKFYKIATRGQCYKTFYVRNLLMIVIN